MSTLNLTVGATGDDTNSQSGTDNAGRSPSSGLNIISADITNVLLSPGSHGTNDERVVAARFTNVTIAQGASISQALFSMKTQASYSSLGTITYLVGAQAADNAGAFTASTNLQSGSRPRTTAFTSWDQKTVSTTGGPNSDGRYQVDITSAVQEVINRAGWVSGNAIVVIVDIDAATTTSEWQDYYAWDDTGNRTTNPPKLDITYGTGGVSLTGSSATASRGTVGADLSGLTPTGKVGTSAVGTQAPAITVALVG